jgi:DNA-binding NarL/FixJ family response regulator
MTPREHDIVDLLLQGYDNKSIGEELGIKTRTIKCYMNRLFMRYGITSGHRRINLAALLAAPLSWPTTPIERREAA